MRFSFSEDQLAFRDALHDFLEKECPPDVARAGHSPGLWKGLAEMGLIGLLREMTEVDLVLLLEEAGRFLVPGPLVETAAVVVPLLQDAARPDLRDRWLGPIASGDVVATAEIEVSGLVWEADRADVLFLRSGSEVHAIHRDAVSLAPEPSFTGAAGRPFRVEFDPTRETLVASGPEGLWAIHAAFDRGALGASALLIGIAARVIEMAARYATEREQFGQPIGRFQAVKHLLADALVRLQFARPVVYRAAHSVAHGSEDRARDVSMAKALASDAAMLACRTALQVHGAIGYTEEHDLHLWLKEGWSLAHSWGDAAWHRDRVADAVI